jgi:hypothetical protein
MSFFCNMPHLKHGTGLDANGSRCIIKGIQGKHTMVKSYILCKFVLVSGNGLMHFSYFLLKAIDFRA